MCRLECGFGTEMVESQKQIGLRSTWFQYILLTSRGIADKWCFSDSRADGSFSSVQGVPTTRDQYTNVNPSGKKETIATSCSLQVWLQNVGRSVFVLKSIYRVYHNEACREFLLKWWCIYFIKEYNSYGWHFWLIWWQMTWAWYPASRFLFKYQWGWQTLGEVCYYKAKVLCSMVCGMCWE